MKWHSTVRLYRLGSLAERERERERVPKKACLELVSRQLKLDFPQLSCMEEEERTHWPSLIECIHSWARFRGILMFMEFVVRISSQYHF